MFDRFHLADLGLRVLAAPMAGGPSTPALAAAVSNSGGLGFLAGGMLAAEELAEAILKARTMTTGAIGVNLFVPQPPTCTPEHLGEFAAALAPESEHYGVALGEPRHDDDEWVAKLEVVCDLRPEMVSFTFGSPSQAQCRHLAGVGISILTTVTTVREAMIAISCGADALVAQGPGAGGHRATFDALAAPSADSLDDMVASLVACIECPVVAAGGLATRADMDRMRGAGATAVQLGTAFLLADEAGTNPVHRKALCDTSFTETVVTRAFTGRYARALRNRFIESYDADSIFGFPQVAMMTAPLQAAALKVGDPHGAAMWTGTAFRSAKRGPAADIVRALAG